jgi:vitamin B12 transporter
MLKNTFGLCLLFCLCYNTGKGQIQTLEAVKISSSEYQKKLRESGRNISVITQDDIKRLPVNTIDDLLKFVPGIEVQQRGPQGSQSDFIIRGGTFQQVLVVIDGMRMNEPLTGHFNSYIPVPLDEIERIEVIKGAAVAMFGPDAVGGVISITTKTFSEDFTKKKKELALGIQGGEYKLNNGNGHLAIADMKNYFSLNGQYNKARGPQLRGTTQFSDNRISSISLGRLLNNNWKLFLRASFDDRDFNAQNFYTTFLSDTAREKVRSSWQQMSLQHKGKRSTFVLMAGARQLQDIYAFRPAVLPNNNKTSLFNVDVRNTTKFNWQQSKITWGSQLFTKYIRSNDRGNHQHLHAGAYVNFQHQPFPRFFISEAIRIDWDQRYKWVMIPQLNMAYVGPRSGLRASIGKGIRDADFTERYNNFNKPLVTGGSIGNPDLQAEKSLNMELGGDLFISEKIQARATWFSRAQDGLIDWVITPYAAMPRKSNLIPAANYALSTNIASVTTRGIELDLDGKHNYKNNMLFYWRTGITILRSRTANETLPSFYLSSHAKTIWNAGAGISGKKGNVSMTALYKLRNTLNAQSINATISPEYMLLNFKAEKFLFEKKLSLQFQVNNLLNRSYSDLLGSMMPGRWTQVGIRYSFSR